MHTTACLARLGCLCWCCALASVPPVLGPVDYHIRVFVRCFLCFLGLLPLPLPLHGLCSASSATVSGGGGCGGRRFCLLRGHLQDSCGDPPPVLDIPLLLLVRYAFPFFPGRGGLVVVACLCMGTPCFAARLRPFLLSFPSASGLAPSLGASSRTSSSYSCLHVTFGIPLGKVFSWVCRSLVRNREVANTSSVMDILAMLVLQSNQQENQSCMRPVPLGPSRLS